MRQTEKPISVVCRRDVVAIPGSYDYEDGSDFYDDVDAGIQEIVAQRRAEQFSPGHLPYTAHSEISVCD